MKEKEKIKEKESNFLSKAIFIWIAILFLEIIIYGILMRDRQYLSKIPVIHNNSIRWIMFIALIVIFLISTILIIVWYIKKKKEVEKE
jgi:uncharacterized protein with PQ loop repeat